MTEVMTETATTTKGKRTKVQKKNVHDRMKPVNPYAVAKPAEGESKRHFSQGTMRKRQANHYRFSGGHVGMLVAGSRINKRSKKHRDEHKPIFDLMADLHGDKPYRMQFTTNSKHTDLLYMDTITQDIVQGIALSATNLKTGHIGCPTDIHVNYVRTKFNV